MAKVRYEVLVSDPLALLTFEFDTNRGFGPSISHPYHAPGMSEEIRTVVQVPGTLVSVELPDFKPSPWIELANACGAAIILPPPAPPRPAKRAPEGDTGLRQSELPG